MNQTAKTFDFLQLFPAKQFEKLTRYWGVDKGVRSLPIKKMLAVFLASCVVENKSLRDIAQSFNVPKSTLGDALSKRSADFFLTVANFSLINLLGWSFQEKIVKNYAIF